MSEDLTVPHVARVIGIDPSTTNMGVCIIDVDLTRQTPFKLVYVNTIKGDKVLYDIPDQFNDLNGTGVLARCYGLARALGEIIELFVDKWEENLNKFVKMMVTGIIEDNFLGASAGTWKQLIQFVSMCYEQFISRDIHVSNVLPNPAKDIVGANFKGTQKEDVMKGVSDYQWLDSDGFDLEVLDDHSADATAITLYRCESIAKHHGVIYAGQSGLSPYE